MHYDIESDSAFCFTCIKAIQHNLISSTKGEAAFTKTGFHCWKKALSKSGGFRKHEQSECHKEAADRWNKIPASVKGDVGEMISSQHALEKFNSRQILLKILRNVRYLGKKYYFPQHSYLSYFLLAKWCDVVLYPIGRQSQPLRGNWDKDKKGEVNSNYYQLIKLRCDEDPSVTTWLEKKSNKYMSVIYPK